MHYRHLHWSDPTPVPSPASDPTPVTQPRLVEPLDRVKELGDASVPFTFDVHAIIYAEDAPSLEKELHREFTNTRVNAVNLRKEFFRTDLLSIKNAVDRISGIDADFNMTILAEEYYETRRLQGNLSQSQ